MSSSAAAADRGADTVELGCAPDERPLGRAAVRSEGSRGDHEQIVDRVDEFLLSKDIVRPGDRLVILMGSPIYQRAKTNLLRVHRVR